MEKIYERVSGKCAEMCIRDSHMWDCEPAGGKDGCEVCGDNAVPVIDRHIRQQPDIGNTGRS